MRRKLEDFLQKVWQCRGFVAWLFRPVSLLYDAAVFVRYTLYSWGILRSYRLPVPVIVVGNVLSGGVGKTPVVIALVQYLMVRGVDVGVISRGYGRKINPLVDDCREVLPGSAPDEVGDEPLLIRLRTRAPVFVARDRVQAAEALLKAHPRVQIIVADDGLQHYALQRDAEICVFDDRGLGNGWTLPAGPLRELWPRRLVAPVQWVLNTGNESKLEGFTVQRSLSDVALCENGRRVRLSGLQGRYLQAVAGIAHPETFFEMLRAKGLDVVSATALPDHADMREWRPVYTDFPLLCTEKDAAKLWRALPEDLRAKVMCVPLHCTLSADFLQVLDTWLLSESYSPTTSGLSTTTI
jgi:tetraacyldisaccharide 4'-kinase